MTVPLIVIVGKYDVWENEFPLDLRKMNPFSVDKNSFEEVFDEDMIYTVSFTLRDLLNRFAPGLVAQAEASFEEVLFLPASSFGTLAETSLSEDSRKFVGVVPSKIDPVWVDIPYYTLLDFQGKLRKKTPPDSGIPEIQGKQIDDKIVFIHPLTQRKEQLPLSYGGHTLAIGKQLYRVPQTSPGSQKGVPKYKDFWN